LPPVSYPVVRGHWDCPGLHSLGANFGANSRLLRLVPEPFSRLAPLIGRDGRTAGASRTSGETKHTRPASNLGSGRDHRPSYRPHTHPTKSCTGGDRCGPPRPRAWVRESRAAHSRTIPHTSEQGHRRGTVTKWAGRNVVSVGLLLAAQSILGRTSRELRSQGSRAATSPSAPRRREVRAGDRGRSEARSLRDL
jgi:hypothetical protein